ncbi:CPBP family glutamic-type intramembrane protease [Anabaena sp. WFMT]|uniref:CPBP family glutamic-type intramembrane protease n=1 Tax=Anabaena sp. WFMT TaxID=3449730 RepID=UPI003F268F84
MLQLLKKRLHLAFTTSINADQLKRILPPLFGLIALLLIIGFKTDFLKIRLISKTWIEIIKITIISLIVPSLSEEIFFRVLFLPHPSENPSTKSQIIWGLVSVILFIIYHPFQGMTWNHSGQDVFINPIFLSLASLLGVVCTITYLKTGSILLSVIIHWLAVVIWLVMLDGLSKFILY